MEIKVLGLGCMKCKQLYQEVERAVQQLGITAALTKIEQINDIMAYQVLMTPALVINGEIKAAGRIPTPAELTGWLTTAGDAKETR
jgi:small redox-active disulfide protein 2